MQHQILAPTRRLPRSDLHTDGCINLLIVMLNVVGELDTPDPVWVSIASRFLGIDREEVESALYKRIRIRSRSA